MQLFREISEMVNLKSDTRRRLHGSKICRFEILKSRIIFGLESYQYADPEIFDLENLEI